MRTLRLVALSDDGKNLILAAEGIDGVEGERFELPVDDRVRAAARGDFFMSLNFYAAAGRR